MDIQVLNRLVQIQNTATMFRAALDNLQDEAAEIMGDGDMAFDFVYGLVGFAEIVHEMENPTRKAWRCE